MSSTPNIVTKLGYDPTDLNKGLEQAKAKVVEYKLAAAQADSDLQNARSRFAEQYSANERRLAQTRLAAAQAEVQTQLANLNKVDAATRAAAVNKISTLNQTISQQKQYLQGYDLEIQKIDQLKAAYAGLAAQTKVAQAQRSVLSNASGEGDYRFTLNRVLSGITPGGAAGVVGAVAGGELLAELPGLLKEVAAGFFEAVRGAAAFAEELQHTKEKTGIAVPELQKLFVIGKSENIDLGQLAKGSKFLSQALIGQDATDEQGNAIAGSGRRGSQVLGALGIKGGANQDLNDVLGKIADKFKELPDGATKLAAAVALFGKAGADFIPFLNNGKDGFDKISKSIENFDFDTSKSEQDLAQLKADEAKFEIAKAELFASMSSLLVVFGDYLSKVADTVNLFLNKNSLENPTAALNKAGGFKLNQEGLNEARRIQDLSTFSSRADEFDTQGGGESEREAAIRQGADAFRKKNKLPANFEVDEGTAIDAYVALNKQFVVTAEESAKADKSLKSLQKALSGADTAAANAAKKLAEQYKTATEETIKLEKAADTKNAQEVLKNFGAAANKSLVDDLAAAIARQKNIGDASPNSQVGLEARTKQVALETERNAVQARYLELVKEETKEKNKRNLDISRNEVDKAFGLPTVFDGVATRGIPLAAPGVGTFANEDPFKNQKILSGANLDDARKLDAQIAAAKVTGQSYYELLAQDKDIRETAQPAIEAQIKALSTKKSLDDSEAAELLKLTAQYEANKKAIKDLQTQLNAGLNFKQLLDGLDSLTAGFQSFGGKVAQTASNIAKGADGLFKTNQFLKGLSSDDSESGGFGTIFHGGTKANGEQATTSDRLQGGAEALGSAAQGIGQIRQGGVGAAAGGAQLGQLVGAAIPVIGPLVGSLVGAVGGSLFAGIFGSQKQTDKIAKQIKEQVKQTLDAISSGTETLIQGLNDLQKEREQAIAQLSGKKGGKAQLQEITDNIDQQVAQLKAQQKQILDKFNQTVGELYAPKGTENYVQTIAQIATTLRDAAGAGASAAQQVAYLNGALTQLKTTVGNDLNDEEKTLLDNLQKEIDLKQQSADIDAAAANQALGVQRSLGLTRGVTAGQGAAQQLRDIENQRQKQQKDITNQLTLVDAQIGQQKSLFKINTDGLTLDQQRQLILKDQLAIQTQITAQTYQQIKNQQEFYANLAAGRVSVPQGVLPSDLKLPTGAAYSLGSSPISSQPLTIQTPQIVIQYSGAADPKVLAQAVRDGILQINNERRSGRS